MQQCREIKYTLSGEKQTYFCDLLEYEPGFGVLRYIIDRQYRVSDYALQPGDVTHGFYWENRPYTLYVWDLPRINRRLHYFNIADSISLRPEEFVWRDLTVDVLIDSGNRIEILDENELPPDLSGELRRYIRTAADLVIERHHEIIREADDQIVRISRGR